jgi:hypothetical protein
MESDPRTTEVHAWQWHRVQCPSCKTLWDAEVTVRSTATMTLVPHVSPSARRAAGRVVELPPPPPPRPPPRPPLPPPPPPPPPPAPPTPPAKVKKEPKDKKKKKDEKKKKKDKKEKSPEPVPEVDVLVELDNIFR